MGITLCTFFTEAYCMGLKFQKMASAVRIYLENEHGDREELLDPGSEVEHRSEKFVPAKRDVDSKKIRKFINCFLF